MNEMVKMVVVLTVLSSVAGGVLAAINKGTASQIEAQQLEFVKGPAIKAILTGSISYLPTFCISCCNFGFTF